MRKTVRSYNKKRKINQVGGMEGEDHNSNVRKLIEFQSRLGIPLEHCGFEHIFTSLVNRGVFKSQPNSDQLFRKLFGRGMWGSNWVDIFQAQLDHPIELSVEFLSLAPKKVWKHLLLLMLDEGINPDIVNMIFNLLKSYVKYRGISPVLTLTFRSLNVDIFKTVREEHNKNIARTIIDLYEVDEQTDEHLHIDRYTPECVTLSLMDRIRPLMRWAQHSDVKPSSRPWKVLVDDITRKMRSLKHTISHNFPDDDATPGFGYYQVRADGPPGGSDILLKELLAIDENPLDGVKWNTLKLDDKKVEDANKMLEIMYLLLSVFIDKKSLLLDRVISLPANYGTFDIQKNSLHKSKECMDLITKESDKQRRNAEAVRPLPDRASQARQLQHRAVLSEIMPPLIAQSVECGTSQSTLDLLFHWCHSQRVSPPLFFDDAENFIDPRVDNAVGQAFHIWDYSVFSQLTDRQRVDILEPVNKADTERQTTPSLVGFRFHINTVARPAARPASAAAQPAASVAEAAAAAAARQGPPRKVLTEYNADDVAAVVETCLHPISEVTMQNFKNLVIHGRRLVRLDVESLKILIESQFDDPQLVERMVQCLIELKNA